MYGAENNVFRLDLRVPFDRMRNNMQAASQAFGSQPLKSMCAGHHSNPFQYAIGTETAIMLLDERYSKRPLVRWNLPPLVMPPDDLMITPFGSSGGDGDVNWIVGSLWRRKSILVAQYDSSGDVEGETIVQSYGVPFVHELGDDECPVDVEANPYSLLDADRVVGGMATGLLPTPGLWNGKASCLLHTEVEKEGVGDEQRFVTKIRCRSLASICNQHSENRTWKDRAHDDAVQEVKPAKNLSKKTQGSLPDVLNIIRKREQLKKGSGGKVKTEHLANKLANHYVANAEEMTQLLEFPHSAEEIFQRMVQMRPKW
eukprot:TRINITY_DN4401_c0_g1_i1.p1 TRINITY_DN4401_c0_g1~~TRINITY_DN4401_c0_g1_i1.p1  ORF type:complete len:314 (-),score=61.57 TRINITY_DN4401_c0_g1_i1:54-995(-)